VSTFQEDLQGGVSWSEVELMAADRVPERWRNLLLIVPQRTSEANDLVAG